MAQITNKVLFKVVVDGSSLNKDLKVINAQTNTTSTAAKNLSRSLSALGTQARAAGIGLSVGLTAPLVILANEAVKAVANFEQAMASVQAVTRATGSEMSQFETIIRDVAKATPYSVTEIAGAIEELSKAGLSVEQILSGSLVDTLYLAAAGEIDMANAANIASRALNTFAKDHLTVAQASDYLVGAANASTAGIDDLSQGLEQASAVANGFNVSFRDTILTLSVFAQNGMQGSDAGTSFKTMLMRLNPVSDEAREKMRELGLITEEGKNIFYDATGGLKSMTDIAEIMQNTFAELSLEQRQQAMQTIFGTDAIRAANVLYKEGAEGFTAMSNAMKGITAEQVAMDKWDNLNDKFTIFKNNVVEVSLKLRDRFVPILEKVLDTATRMVIAFGNASPAVQNIVLALGFMAAALGPLLIMVSVIANLINSFSRISQLLTTVGEGFSGLIGAGTLSTFSAFAGVLGVISGIILGIIGINAMAAKSYDEHMKKVKGVTKTYEEMIDNVSTEAGSMVEAFQEVNNTVGATFDKVKSSMDISTETGEFIANVQKLGDSSIQIIEASTKEQYDTLANLFDTTETLSAESEQAILDNTLAKKDEQIRAIEASINIINEIYRRASDEHRSLSDEEEQYISANLSKIQENTASSLSATQAQIIGMNATFETGLYKSAQESSVQMVELVKQSSEEKIKAAQEFYGYQLYAIEKAHTDGTMADEEYEKEKLASLARLKQAIIDAQREEAQALVDKINNQKEFIKYYDDLVDKQTEYQTAVNNGFKLTPAQQQDFDNITNELKDLTDTYDGVTESVKGSKTELIGMDEAAKAGIDGIEELDPTMKNVGDSANIMAGNVSSATANLDELANTGVESVDNMLKSMADNMASQENSELISNGTKGIVQQIEVALKSGEGLGVASTTNMLDLMAQELASNKNPAESAYLQALAIATGLDISTATKEDYQAALQQLSKIIQDSDVDTKAKEKGKDSAKGFKDGAGDLGGSSVIQSLATALTDTSGMYNKGYLLGKALLNGFNSGKSGGVVGPVKTGVSLPALATGGVITSGTALVGEAGPELLTVSGARTQVTPLTNNQASNALSTLGGNNFEINISGFYGDENLLVNKITESINRVIGGKVYAK